MSDDLGKPEKPSMPSDDDIAARFERIREDLKHMDLPDLPDDEKLRARIEGVTSQKSSYKMPEVPEFEIKRPIKPAANGTPGAYNYRSLGIGMSAAYSLIGSMAVGFGLGWVFDHFTHSTYGQPVGAVLGSILGIASAVFLINRDSGGK